MPQQTGAGRFKAFPRSGPITAHRQPLSLLAKERVKVVTGFGIGPGVAPLADLYMVRVFGCTGSTDVVTDAIDWAVHNNMDVISMSLGGAYGT